MRSPNFRAFSASLKMCEWFYTAECHYEGPSAVYMFKGKTHTCNSTFRKSLRRLYSFKCFISHCYKLTSRSQWPCGLRRRPSAAHLLRLWVRIPSGAWMFVCCECCVLSGRGLCDGLITRPGESYRLWCVVVCDQETSKTRRLKPATGLWKYNHNGL